MSNKTEKSDYNFCLCSIKRKNKICTILLLHFIMQLNLLTLSSKSKLCIINLDFETNSI